MKLEIIKKAFVLLSLVMTLQASDEIERENYTEAWKSTTIKETLFELYGKELVLEEIKEINVTVPPISENGRVIPFSIKSEIPLKSIAIMQEIKGNKSLIAFIKIPKSKRVNYNLRLNLGSSFNGKVITVSEGVSGQFYKTINRVNARFNCCFGCLDSNEVIYTKEQIEAKRNSLKDKKNRKYKLRLNQKKKMLVFLSLFTSCNYKESKDYGLPVQFTTHLKFSQDNQTIVEIYTSEYISDYLYFKFDSRDINTEEPLSLFITNINGNIIEEQSNIDGTIKYFQ